MWQEKYNLGIWDKEVMPLEKINTDVIWWNKSKYILEDNLKYCNECIILLKIGKFEFTQIFITITI